MKVLKFEVCANMVKFEDDVVHRSSVILCGEIKKVWPSFKYMYL